MSQKRDGSTSPSDEEMMKKVKLDASSSSGSASVIGTPTNEDGLKPLMESRYLGFNLGFSSGFSFDSFMAVFHFSISY